MTDNQGPDDYRHFPENIYFILHHRKAVPVTDISIWDKFLGDYRRNRVRRTYLPNKTFVSTVFLGLDHQWGYGPPMLFETMIKAENDWLVYRTRCTTWRQALKMHWTGVTYAKSKTD